MMLPFRPLHTKISQQQLNQMGDIQPEGMDTAGGGDRVEVGVAAVELGPHIHRQLRHGFGDHVGVLGGEFTGAGRFIHPRQVVSTAPRSFSTNSSCGSLRPSGFNVVSTTSFTST